MKAFEFGLGIFFPFFPLPLPLVPSGRQGEEIESRCWWELLSRSLPQAPLARGMSESMAAVCPPSTEAVRRTQGSPV